MKSVLFTDRATGQPAVLMIQGFVYEDMFYGVQSTETSPTPSPVSYPLETYLEILDKNYGRLAEHPSEQRRA